MRFLTVLLILMIASVSFGQVAIFGSEAAPADTTTLTDATALASRLIKYNAYPEGVATLVMAADSLTGAPIGVVGKYRLWFGKTISGEDIYGPYRTLTDSVLVKADISNPAVYGSSDQVARDTNIANDTYWAVSLGIQFQFTGVGTQTCLLVGYFLFY